MRIKKEYIALAVVIVALALYLIFKNTDKTHYSLPESVPVEKPRITRLAIHRSDSTVTLKRQDDLWRIQPQGYPADQGSVDKMLDAVSNFTLTTLVAESRNYTQYDLTDEKKIGVEAFDGDTVLRKFDIGKTASTYRHTFVLLDQDPKVYQARDNIRSVFDTDLEKLRDKTVMTIEKDAVTGIALAGGEGSLALRHMDIPSLINPPAEDDTAAAGPGPPWRTEDGKAADEKAVDRLINSLADLKCDGYIYDKTKADLTDAVFTVTVEGPETVSLSIFEKQDEKYPAVSSQNDYPFLLPEWRVKQIMKKPEELLKKEPGN